MPDYPESPPIMVNPKPLPPPPFLPNQFEKPIDSVDYFPQVDAVFPGGKIEMNKFITSNWKHQDRGISNEGRVYVSMIIEKDGSIRNVQISRGVSKEFDAEALRVIRAMPNWIPAETNGKIVATKVQLPIGFK